MTFPPLPEVPELLADKLPLTERLAALRLTLERVRQELDELGGHSETPHQPAAEHPCLFETSPQSFESRPGNLAVQTIIEPVPPKPDAFLEKATLEELNMALGLAFAQISNRRTW
jgi:hypothetical protein